MTQFHKIKKRPPSLRREGDKKDIRSRRWARFRRWYLAQHPLCEECLKAGRTRPAEEIHHIRPRREAPEAVFDEKNVVALCRLCHRRVHLRRDMGSNP